MRLHGVNLEHSDPEQNCISPQRTPALKCIRELLLNVSSPNPSPI
jgi:hypothetical protein